ncbi:hypothetical protein B5807_03327 [Epicoccum nigrum]|jgi:hypothetical protein|uniref:Uncharacterized protein n=1 Tax=Epicoccum nigrum TaxID=105696 RepID=A0A1Y2M8H5_EPING|nr:hypothetical protein B5807_03327 [Epicoccum nigrum]
MLRLCALLLAVLLGNYLKKQMSITSSDLICDPSTFYLPTINGVALLSLSAEAQKNYSTPALDISLPITNVNFCKVNIHLTHEGANDNVLVRIWPPLDRAA